MKRSEIVEKEAVKTYEVTIRYAAKSRESDPNLKQNEADRAEKGASRVRSDELKGLR